MIGVALGKRCFHAKCSPSPFRPYRTKLSSE